MSGWVGEADEHLSVYVYGFASLPAGKILTYGTGAPPTYLPNGPSPEAPGEMRVPRVGAVVCVRAMRLEGRVCRCCSGAGGVTAEPAQVPSRRRPRRTSRCPLAAPPRAQVLHQSTKARQSAMCGGGGAHIATCTTPPEAATATASASAKAHGMRSTPSANILLVAAAVAHLQFGFMNATTQTCSLRTTCFRN